MQGAGAACLESLSPLFQAIASRAGSPEARAGGVPSPPMRAASASSGGSGGSGARASSGHQQQEVLEAQKEWQRGGPPSAPTLTPRTEGSFRRLQQGNNPLADSAASVALAGRRQRRPGGGAHARETLNPVPAAAAEAAAPMGSSGAPSPAASEGQGSSGGGGNPFRGWTEGANTSVPAQQRSPPGGNPFAGAPAPPPAGQAANSPYSVPPSEEGSCSGAAHRRSSDSVHWRTNLAASWEEGDASEGDPAAAAGRAAMGGRASVSSGGSAASSSLSPLGAGRLARQQEGPPCSPAIRPDLQRWMHSLSLNAATS